MTRAGINWWPIPTEVSASIQDGPNLDAFSRLRVSDPQTLFASQCQYDSDPLLFETGATGTGSAGAHSANTRMTALACTAGVGTSFIQSYEYIPYQPGKCVGSGELITLAGGERVTAASLVGKEFRLHTIVDGRMAEVAAFADVNEFEPVYRITTQSGRVIVRNGEHPLWAANKTYAGGAWRPGAPPKVSVADFRKTGDLEVGDLLCLASTSPYVGASSDMSKDDLAMLALMIGDGSMTQPAVSFTKTEGAQTEEFCRIAQDMGCAVRHDTKLRYAVRKAEFGAGKNNVVKMLEKHGLLGAASRGKFVPTAVFKQNNALVAHFLNRLFSTDGWAYGDEDKHKAEIGYGSMSERLVRDVQHLLSRLGIRAVVTQRARFGDWVASISQAASIMLFAECVGILGKEQAVQRAVTVAAKKLQRPMDGYLRENVPADGFVWEPIASIEELPEQWTIAICVPGPETFVTDFYEHNSQLVFVTGLLGAGAVGATVDVGFFDGTNGFFLRQNGTSGLQLVRRTSTSGGVVEEAVAQANWSQDPLTGAGPSGLTLDPTKVFILAFDAQFLGMGRCRVYFDINGQLIEAHHFLHANILAVPYMQTLSLPIQMLVTTASAAKTAFFKCASVSSEGGLSEDLAFPFSTVEQTVTAANGTDTHVGGIRPFLTFNSITNRARIVINSIDILPGTNSAHWKLAIGSTFSAGPTWGGAAVSTFSGVEQTTAVGTVSAVGTVIASGYVAGSAQARTVASPRLSQRYPITLNRAGANRANGTLHLFVAGIGGNSACRAVFNYAEVR